MDQAAPHRLRRIAFAAAVVLMTAACATTPAQTEATNPESRASERGPLANDPDVPTLGSLGQYDIPAGRCGMILYTKSATGPVAIFRSTDDGRALMTINGETAELRLVGRGGEPRQNVPPLQSFTGPLPSGETVSVIAQTSWGRAFPGGAYVQSGTLTATTEAGWSRVVPIAGIAGCKATA